MKNYKIVFVSKNDDFKISRENTIEFANKHQNVKFNYIANNKKSLTTVYNKIINEHRLNKDIDYLILMHADVMLDLEKFIEHIESVDGKYDVIGLCGCSKISVSQKNLNWWTGSNPFPEYKWGCVTHGELGNKMSFFSSHHPNVTDHEVACIDGLCIILTKKVIEAENGLLFDEQFQFGQYDTDISFQCVFKYKYKLGVIIRKDLQHYSVGKSILTEEFQKYDKILKEKWKLV